jgi:Holliday junction resolvase RusA-like endonuclease
MFYRIPFENADVSKPRGKIAKAGHIYHSSPEYKAYKTKIFKLLSGTIDFEQQIRYPIGIGFVHAFSVKPSQNDLDNLIGAISDCLTQHGTVTDDSERYIQTLHAEAIESGVGDHGVIYLWSIEDNSLVNILELMFQDLECFAEANRLYGYQYKYPARF